MDIVKEFKKSDFKQVRRYLDIEDEDVTTKLLTMLKDCKSDDFIQKSLIIKELIYKCKHCYPDAKFSQHAEFQEMKYEEECGVHRCDYDDEYKEYLKQDDTVSLYCSKCGLDIKKLVSIRESIEWIEHCAAVEGWY